MKQMKTKNINYSRKLLEICYKNCNVNISYPTVFKGNTTITFNVNGTQYKYFNIIVYSVGQLSIDCELDMVYELKDNVIYKLLEDTDLKKIISIVKKMSTE